MVIGRVIGRITKQLKTNTFNCTRVAEEVYSELDFIDVEELWDRSGSKRDGYVDPGEMAWEMFEEALQPFIDEMKKHQKLSMPNAAKYQCMGILKGIYRFYKESNSEFKDWAVDAPGEYFGTVLDEWRDSCESSEDLEEMETFIKEKCPTWA